MKKGYTLWFDLINTSHVLFFDPFFEKFKEENLIITSRDLAETAELLSSKDIVHKTYGIHWGEIKPLKLFGYFFRGLKMLPYVRDHDFALSHGSLTPLILKKLFDGKTISFYDNENSIQFKQAAKYSDYFFVPKILEKDALKFSSRHTKIMTYPGIKEQVYLADFKPDRSKIESIPFDDYLVVRAEAWKSHYVDKGKIMAYHLIKKLNQSGYKIVFLPRYDSIPLWMQRSKDIFIPSKPLDGPQVCRFSQGVLTGSGTLAREASVLGIPSVSFYPSKPLKVDLYLEKHGLIIRTRDIRKIIGHIKNSERRTGMIKESKKVRDALFDQLISIFDRDI